ncbi:MAG TPA: C45 family peptidase [Burkholderiales bacterium]|nr:C45 family peptidase [Burkholderiales bacterium]
MSAFPVLELSGVAFERGRQHGERARERVERSLANYARLFPFVGMAWAEAQRRAAAFRDVIGSFDATLLEEMEGIARGAGRPFGELLALNVRTEILPASFLTGADLGECTALAVAPSASATGGTLLAQNWDWVGAQRDSMVILRVREGAEPACLTLTEAGMLAKIGFNDRGFGVCLNILRSVFDGGTPGIPVHVLLRALLKRSDVSDAVAFCSRLAFGGSSNVLCADRSGELASLEFSPRGLKVLRGEGATLCHTNHFLHADALGWQAEQAPNLSSQPRLRRARELACARPRHAVEDVQRALRDESDGLLSICRRPDRSLPPEAQLETVASVVMELARGVMHVAPDVPSRADYVPVGLASEGEVALA